MRHDRVAMRVGPLAVAVLALLAAPPPHVRADGQPTLQETVVYPTGDPAQDVANVREAVRAGGTVLLKATDVAGNPQVFHFGDFPVAAIDFDTESGWIALGTAGEIVGIPVESRGRTLYVSLGNDVRLVGETVGKAMTTIHGGINPVRSDELKNVPGVGLQRVFGLSNMSVEGIRFTESALQSIILSHFTFQPEVLAFLRDREIELKIDIQGNQFVDGKPALGFVWYALAAVITGSAGATNVSGNRVQFTSGRWDAAERAYEASRGLNRRPEFWEGLSFPEMSARGKIDNNHVEGVDVGIVVVDLEGSEFVQVAGNMVQLRPGGVLGIALESNHRYLVERNTVVAPGTNPDGIVVGDFIGRTAITGSTIRHNRVVMDGSWFGAISLYGAGSGNYFGQNTVEGSAAYALGVVADVNPTAPAAENAFAGNNIARFEPIDSPFFGSGAHVFFDVHTRDNVFAGYSGIVKDLGVNNSITGTPDRGHGPGEELREALKQRKELLRHFRER